ncbi:alpha/beta hydrolase [Actinoplanes derwentensis]|uniref:alpha/beta hydrolase n=1 Tax=Actinoplanes derwentensis TaxID=113562 RepID=UPI000AC3F6F6|nr:hypothetical protein [Actinoplanes derwentensis]GID89770.1 hypothetical protein Ade03nite_86940 [Actinoplanes derwentensis]
MTPTESRLLLADAGLTDLPPPYLFSTVRTNAWTDAEPAGRKHSLPLIVLSPGFGKPRSELTGLAEDLASGGYVVVAIEHTYESVATTFPDGRVTTCVACETPVRDPAFWRTVTQGRAADVSFVLDQLTGPHPQWNGAALIDPRRFGMSGQPVGGAATQATMVTDARVDAGIDVDGHTGLSRPFMFLGRGRTTSAPDCRPPATGTATGHC